MVRVLTWNIFHGRDFPPDPALFTARSRLLRVTERNATHVQVNRPLRREFAQVLAGFEWDLALLQEAPPRWRRHLADAAGASDGASGLTSRNRLAPLRAGLAWLNPDLIGSNEGGSNQLLARPPWRLDATDVHPVARAPERRTMLLARLAGPDGRALAVANLHGTTGHRAAARREVVAAAAAAVEWAGDVPLVFGGDVNLRPARAPEVFAELEERFGLAGAAATDAIDHLLVRGARVVEPPRALPPEARELLRPDGRALRLSDHAPVVAALDVG